jgi:3-deoxy-D-manno-octulosonic acid kinase
VIRSASSDPRRGAGHRWTLPDGFDVVERWGGVLVARTAVLDEIPPASGPGGLAAAFARRPGAREHRGRGPCWSIPLADGTRAVLRHYRHGGVLAPITRDLFWGRVPRPILELAISEELRARGVPTPEVLALFVRPRRLGFYQADLITREVPACIDLGRFLARTAGRPAERRWRRRVLGAAGRAVGRMHDAGLDHADLNLRNLVVSEDSGPSGPAGASGARPVVWVLDLDRAALARPLPLARRIRQLRRMERSLAKLSRDAELASDRDRIAFLRGYFGPGLRSALAAHFGRTVRR